MEEFARTVQGRKYFQKDLPELIKSNNRLAAALEKQNKLKEKRFTLEAKKQLNERNIRQ